MFSLPFGQADDAVDSTSESDSGSSWTVSLSEADESPAANGAEAAGSGAGGRTHESMFPGRHSKAKRDAILKLLPFVRTQLQGSTLRNPGALDKPARRAFITAGLLAAAEQDAALCCWGPAPLAYRSRRGVEDAIANMYWQFVCESV